jgi:hypothetical protein
MSSKFPAAPGSPSLLAANGIGRPLAAPVAGFGAAEELPPPDTKRWVIRRKAVVVSAVRSGVLTLEEACERYKLSLEEFLSWQRLIDSHGLAGLRVTRLQDYRGQRARAG